MILAAILGIIKSAFSLFVKAVAWLLVALSLWIPFIYSVLFIIICGLTDKDFGSVSSFYFFGLIACFFAAFAFSGFKRERAANLKSKKNAERAALSTDKVLKKEQRAELKKKQSALETGAYAETSELNESAQPVHSAPQSMTLASQPVAQPLTPVQQSAIQPIMPAPQSVATEPQTIAPAPVYNFYEFKKDTLPYGEDDATGGLLSNIKLSSELRSEPKVFATRFDPTVFVYEYPDRLDLYKRTRGGMVYMESRPKETHKATND